jgi:BolA family transcriptional regulator, general stress-responsive regulator
MMAALDREARLRQRLESRFEPTFLHILDEGQLHAGHAGAADGRGHYRVKILSAAFRGLTPLARHRLVYAAVADLLETDIHALSLEALPTLER